MEDDYQEESLASREEEETTKQILEEIAEEDEEEEDEELLQQGMLPTKKHQNITIQSIDQIKQIVSFNQFDLIDAKGGLDLVVVNGDQLIVHFLRDSCGKNESKTSVHKLDWAQHGGQFLHLIYLVETFIKNLLDRDMRIDVVFFDDISSDERVIKGSFILNLAFELYKELNVSFEYLAYSFLLAKQVIMRHLSTISTNYSSGDQFTVTKLVGTWHKSQPWADLLMKKIPSFIIGMLSSSNTPGLFTVDDLFCTEAVLINHQTFTYEHQFYGNTVTAFCSAVRENMASSFKTSDVEMFLEKQFNDEMLNNLSSMVKQTTGDKEIDVKFLELKKDIDQIIDNSLSTSYSKWISQQKEAISLITLSLVNPLCQHTTPNSLSLSKILLLTTLAQSILPLKDRAQYLEVNSPSSLLAFNTSLMSSAYHILKQSNYDNLFDLFDFRLFTKVLTLLFSSGNLSKLENTANDNNIIATLLPTEFQTLFKDLSNFIDNHYKGTSGDKSWWEKEIKPLVASLSTPIEGEYKPRHPDCLLRELLSIDNETLVGLSSDLDLTLPHVSKKVEEPKVVEEKPEEPAADDWENQDIEDWEKEDWIKEEKVVEEKVEEVVQENLTEEEAKEVRFEKSYPVREQETNYSQKKDIDEVLPNSFAGPKTDWEKHKVQEAQKRLHRYSESIKSFSEKKIIETAKSSGMAAENTSPNIEKTDSTIVKSNKPTSKNSKKEAPVASSSSTAGPSTKVRLMMIDSNIKKREKEINEYAGKYQEYLQKFSENSNKADELKEHGGKIEPYEHLVKLLLEGVFKDIRVVQNIQATSDPKKGASDSFNTASQLVEQRMTCENLWIQLSTLRLQFMTRKLLLERQDLQNSLRRQTPGTAKKGVKFLNFEEDSEKEEPKEEEKKNEKKDERKGEKKKGALKDTKKTEDAPVTVAAISQIDNLCGGADLDLSQYWEPFELAIRIYEILRQLTSDSYIGDLAVATSASQEKPQKAAKAKKPSKGDKKPEKIKPLTKINLKETMQSLVTYLCDLGFVNFALKFSEKFNIGDISYGSMIKENIMQTSDLDEWENESISVKSDSVNDKPESAEFQLIYNSAIIDSATNLEIPPQELPETVLIESKPAKKVHPRKDKTSKKKDEAEEEEPETPTPTSATPISNIVMPTAKSLGFTPDPWQEQMIMSILQNKSILVSAPTSSGKTFIAFFAMEKILRESDDAIIVYCCPSKALVNQAYAEVYSRFQKVYSNTSPHGVSSMLGMYTADEKINVTTCQVLVTVPQSLEVLMTSAENLEWKRRMKYIILDEIHCINESSSSGQVWEHVLSLLECPFIALSASIGNPKDFADWLNENYNKDILGNISQFSDFSTIPKGVDLVVHDERPRPLEFYNYDAYDYKFTEIHPVATLNPNSIDPVSFSHIQNFSPYQCLTLFRTMRNICNSWKEEGRAVTSDIEDLLHRFDPEVFFNSFGLFRRQEFASYGKSMKEALVTMSNQPNNHAFLLETIQALLSDVKKSFESTEKPIIKQDEETLSESDEVSTSSRAERSKFKFGSDAWLKDNIIDLVTRLAKEKLLPSIFFSFDRNMCDALVRKIAAHLRTARENSQLGNYFHLYPSSLEKVRSEKEIRYSLQSLEQFGDAIPLELREALEVGVAVHHHNCPSDYLTEVERLFRLRCLPIVISTSTLALGIHMPCKTVVMVGHSIYLTTTMFQQCAGRSGRRGYDVKGRVVLYGISQAVANRLLSGVTPKIKGAMGLRSTFLLKMISLLNKAEAINKEKPNDEKLQIIKDDLKRLINKKVFYLGTILENSEIQNKMNFRYILEFLRRNNYLLQDGSLNDFSIFCNLISNYEPSNFLFIHLLKSGSIGSYLQTWKDKLEETSLRPDEKVEMLGEKLLILMNALFESRKLSQWDLSEFKLQNYYSSLSVEEAQQARKNSDQSLLSDNIISQLKDYNKMLLKIYTTFVVSYCKNYPKETADNILPLSKISFPDSAIDSELCNMLRDNKLTYFGTSSFYALSGNDDSFSSITQLLQGRNHTVILDPSLLPYLELVERISQKDDISLSSFALEFLRNGQKRKVMIDCDFSSLSICLNSLKNFDRVLGQVLYNLHLVMHVRNGASNDLFLSTLTKLRYRFHDRVTGGRKTRKKMKYLKTLVVEMDDRDMIKGSGAKLKNQMKSTRKDAVTKETGSMMD